MISRPFARTTSAVLTSAALLVSGLAAQALPAAPLAGPVLAASAARQTAVTRATPLRWSAATCSSDVREVAGDLPRPSLVECATLRVPLDRAHPAAGAIRLKITRVRSSAQSRATRVLFVNPGGPGGPADWLAPALAARFPALHRSHMIVAVDPRGTGGSTPLDCDVVPNDVPDLRNPGSAELQAMQAATAATVSMCAAAHGRYLPHITTAETVADLDAVRGALGANRIDWYGVSAGTWLGARYAQTYPRRIGRLVLDSSVDITSDWRRSFAMQPRGFQRRYDTQFIPWIARHNAVYGLGRTPVQVKARIEAIRAAAGRGEMGQFTPSDLDALIAVRLYDDHDMQRMAEDLAVLDEGTSASRLAAIRRAAQAARQPAGMLTAEDTVFMAVQCNDFAWSRSPGSYSAEGRRLGRAYPLVGWTWMTSPCATWPYRPTPTRPLRAGVLPAGLLLQNEMDPATPLEGARRVLKAQKRLRAVVVDDEGSHGVLVGRNTCAETHALRYLTRGTLPRRDVVCPGTPLPGERTAARVGARLTAASLRR